MPLSPRRTPTPLTLAPLLLVASGAVLGGYTNFEVSHVHPIDLTPSGDRLLAINTPDALLEVFTFAPDGAPVPEAAIPVGLEPVSVRARNDTEAWVVNHLSDTVSIVDLTVGATVDTLHVGDEPTDVVFVGSRAFVSVSQEDAVKVYNLNNLAAAPATLTLAGRDVRALAVSADSTKVYAVVQRSGNGTTVLGIRATFPSTPGTITLDPDRLSALGLRDIECEGPSPAYPPLPPYATNPLGGTPRVGLIVEWNEGAGQWRDEAGQTWNDCLSYSPADNDLFVIDVGTLGVTAVGGLGTALFEVSVQPDTGKLYVPGTEARNAVRFELEGGVTGHVVDNRIAVVDPSNGNAVSHIDLNTHIDRGSLPETNLAEREASISQPGMLVWKDASVGYLTAIGSRKLFRVDGACLSGGCIFGADRAAPEAVVVGEGPTGVVFRPAPQPADERLYVLNRISHSLAVVQASSLTLLDEIALHDPSSQATRDGRRFLYDAIDTSGHGDAACSSCHLSGDHDGLAWDLGNPEGAVVPYSTAFDNVRFVVPQGGQAVECDAQFCADQTGFDPRKGPMVTQTLRGMLEPLHWRGDRPTVNAFNPAFVGLLGAENQGSPTDPRGLSVPDMETFRQFALEIHLPPNPYRTVDDATPCGPRSTDPGCEVQPHGALFPGNPTEGALLFDNHPSDAGQPCKACHEHPFGTAGGQLGGVEPTEPTSPAAAALFFGAADGSPDSDLKIPHLRNMYDKLGPILPAAGDASMPPTPSGFGYTHDGAIPDLYRFLSAQVFTLSEASQAQQVRDLVAFMFHFPTDVKPAVGVQVTLPQGTPPTGTPDEESLLGTLVGLGALSDTGRHCELVAATVADGRVRRYALTGPGSWSTDLAADPPLSTQGLRESATQPVTFTCVPLDSGLRLGGDRDEDTVLDGDDCAPADGSTIGSVVTVTGVVMDASDTLTWTDQAPLAGPSIRYDVLGATLVDLAATGPEATACIAGGVAGASFQDLRPDPDAGDGYFYLIRATNPCGSATVGAGRESIDALSCAP